MAKTRTARKPKPENWVASIRESSHDVVLAGLASLARAYGHGRKPATADFNTLVTEGRSLEPELHDAARRAWGDWVEKPTHAMGLRAEGRLQGVFDERVRSALARLGVPSAEDIAELRASIEQLLAALPGTGTASAAKRNARPTARRVARPKAKVNRKRRGSRKAD